MRRRRNAAVGWTARVANQQVTRDHGPIGMGTNLFWCMKKDLTYTPGMVQSGKCPYCNEDLTGESSLTKWERKMRAAGVHLDE